MNALLTMWMMSCLGAEVDSHWDRVAAALCESDAIQTPEAIPEPLQRAIERFSVRHELWDGPGWNWGSAKSEIEWVRNHYRLVLPRLSDLSRFPAKCQIDACVKDAQDHIEMLERVRDMTADKQRLCAAILDAQIALGPWLRLQAAYGTAANRVPYRHELSALRVLIGQESYQAGLMPLHVPAWHWSRR